MRFLSNILIIVIFGIFILLRTLILSSTDMYEGDTSYYLRQSVYILAWLSMMPFIFFYPFNNEHSEIKEKKFMKNISLLAMLGCGAKFIVTVWYLWKYMPEVPLMQAMMGMELLIWLVLTLFFYYIFRDYAERQRKQQKYEAHLESHCKS